MSLTNLLTRFCILIAFSSPQNGCDSRAAYSQAAVFVLRLMRIPCGPRAHLFNFLIKWTKRLHVLNSSALCCGRITHSAHTSSQRARRTTSSKRESSPFDVHTIIIIFVSARGSGGCFFHSAWLTLSGATALNWHGIFCSLCGVSVPSCTHKCSWRWCSRLWCRPIQELPSWAGATRLPPTGPRPACPQRTHLSTLREPTCPVPARAYLEVIIILTF